MKTPLRILNPAVLLLLYVACLPPTAPVVQLPKELASAAGSPVVPVPADRWEGGELKPGPIHIDSTWNTGEPRDIPYPHAVATSGNFVFYATGQGIELFDVSDPARPVKGRYADASELAPYWGHSDQDFFMNTISVPPDNDDIAATGAREFGFIVWNTQNKLAPTIHYQDGGSPGIYATSVYAVRLADGRDYAFVTDGNSPGGVAMYDLTAAALLSQCHENTLSRSLPDERRGTDPGLVDLPGSALRRGFVGMKADAHARVDVHGVLQEPEKDEAPGLQLRQLDAESDDRLLLRHNQIPPGSPAAAHLATGLATPAGGHVDRFRGTGPGSSVPLADIEKRRRAVVGVVRLVGDEVNGLGVPEDPEPFADLLDAPPGRDPAMPQGLVPGEIEVVDHLSQDDIPGESDRPIFGRRVPIEEGLRRNERESGNENFVLEAEEISGLDLVDPGHDLGGGSEAENGNVGRGSLLPRHGEKHGEGTSSSAVVGGRPERSGLPPTLSRFHGRERPLSPAALRGPFRSELSGDPVIEHDVRNVTVPRTHIAGFESVATAPDADLAGREFSDRTVVRHSELGHRVFHAETLSQDCGVFKGPAQESNPDHHTRRRVSTVELTEPRETIAQTDEESNPAGCGVFKGFLPNGGSAVGGADDFIITTSSGVRVEVYHVTGAGVFTLELSGDLLGNVGSAVMWKAGLDLLTDDASVPQLHERLPDDERVNGTDLLREEHLETELAQSLGKKQDAHDLRTEDTTGDLFGRFAKGRHGSLLPPGFVDLGRVDEVPVAVHVGQHSAEHQLPLPIRDEGHGNARGLLAGGELADDETGHGRFHDGLLSRGAASRTVGRHGARMLYHLAGPGSTLGMEGGLALRAGLGAPGHRVLRRVASGSGVTIVAAGRDEPRIFEHDTGQVFAADRARLEAVRSGDVRSGAAHRGDQLSGRGAILGDLDDHLDAYHDLVPEGQPLADGHSFSIVAHSENLSQPESAVYYLAGLGSIYDGVKMRSYLWIYDISCIATASCGVGLPAPLATYEVTDHSKTLARMTTLSISEDRYLYVGNTNVGGACVPQREYLLDMGRFDPASPPALAELDLGLGFEGWYYSECPTGFRDMQPRAAKVKDGYAYRVLWRWADSFEILAPPPELPALIFRNGFEEGDLSAWSAAVSAAVSALGRSSAQSLGGVR